MNWSAGLMAETPAGLVTVTSTVPLPGGLVALIWVSEATVKWAPADPNCTPSALVNPLPVMMTLFPPAGLPLFGEIWVTAGGDPV